MGGGLARRLLARARQSSDIQTLGLLSCILSFPPHLGGALYSQSDMECFKYGFMCFLNHSIAALYSYCLYCIPILVHVRSAIESHGRGSHEQSDVDRNIIAHPVFLALGHRSFRNLTDGTNRVAYFNHVFLHNMTLTTSFHVFLCVSCSVMFRAPSSRLLEAAIRRAFVLQRKADSSKRGFEICQSIRDHP